MKKELYEQPLAEIFEVRLSASVLNNGSPEPGAPGETNSYNTYEEDF